MLGLKRRRSTGAGARPRLPAGHRLYAVGDVHGRDDLLAGMLERIHSDHAQRPPARLTLVFLGDLIDRGPASRDVVERLRTYAGPADRLVCLAGNHEEVLLDILDGNAGVIRDWLRFGGAECLASYDADVKAIRALPPDEAVAAIRAAIPAGHADFLRGFDDTFRAGDYLFVHAGIRPGTPLDDQLRDDLRWIREPFLNDERDHGFLVVHGHTIRPEVERFANRIGIDTGAYRTGRLSALALEGSRQWFLESSSE